jgi:hypothetical protein
MVEVYTCKKCGFQCASLSLYEQHMKVEDSGMSEYQYMQELKKQKRLALEKLKKEYGSNRD